MIRSGKEEVALVENETREFLLTTLAFLPSPSLGQLERNIAANMERKAFCMLMFMLPLYYHCAM